MEWNIVVGIVCTVLGATLSYVAFSRNKTKDDKSEGQQTGVVLTELGYIKDKVVEDESASFDSFDHDPSIGLIPDVNFDLETGEIFDETIMDEWGEASDHPDTDIE